MNNQNQPLFGKNSRTINSPITKINRSMSPIPSISLNNMENNLSQSNNVYSIPSVNPQSPFSMMLNNTLGQSIPEINMRSTGTSNININQPSALTSGLVTKSYKFNDNSKEIHKFILYIKNKKQFNTSKKLIDLTFFEFLERLSKKKATLRSQSNAENMGAPVVTFDGNLNESKIVHISNGKAKQHKQSISLSLESKAADNHKKHVSIPSASTAHTTDFFKQCDLCPKTFDDPNNYRLHKKQHVIMNGGKNVCPKCFKGFARTDAMKRHLGTKTCDRNRKKLIDENNGVMPERPPKELQLESELST
ncbi:unnamed protein product [Hanseniaspora opuntiae]|jgi:hypothetical protein